MTVADWTPLVDWSLSLHVLQACEWCEGPDASKDLMQAWKLVDEFASAEADRVFLKLLLQLEKKQADEQLLAGNKACPCLLNFAAHLNAANSSISDAFGSRQMLNLLHVKQN